MSTATEDFLAVGDGHPTTDWTTGRIPRESKPYERPLLEALDGSGLEPYTRSSGYGDTYTDKTALTEWLIRMAMIGVAVDESLQLAICAHNQEPDMMKEFKERAHANAEAGAAATTGTAIHKLCDSYDRGDTPYVPPKFAGDVSAYMGLTTGLFEVVEIEQFCVNEEFHCAGTPDRIYRLKRDLRLPDKYAPEKARRVLPKGTVVIGDLKGLALTEKLPTPRGWTTMGDVQPGEQVIGSDGRPCTVTAKSTTKRIGTYVVTFDDGAKVTCDREHIWWVYGGGYGKDAIQRNRAVGIEEIARRFRSPEGQCWWRVPMPKPVELPWAELEIDPYLLGCWLGDGHHTRPVITKGRDLFEILECNGHELGVEQRNHSDQVFTRTVHGLIDGLRRYGLLGNKHIPDAYMRASLAQRQRLLWGLMDTDGTWNTARQRAVFSTTDKALALQVEELLLTLGQRPHVAEFQGHGFGKSVTAYHVEFLPVELMPFRLPRKRDKVTTDVPTTRSRRRLMVAIEEGPDVETACIAVDSPDHTYLCGERMVPTHNTGKSLSYNHVKFACQFFLYSGAQRYTTNLDRMFWYRKYDEQMPGGDRTPWLPDGELVDQSDGLLLHMPAGSGQIELRPIDLEKGRHVAEFVKRVREERKLKTIGPKIDLQLTWQEAIAGASSLEVLRNVWIACAEAQEATDEIKAAMVARSKELAA